MAMTERVKMLRNQSLEAVETLSSERAELLTAFYHQDKHQFHLLQHLYPLQQVAQYQILLVL